MRSRTAPCSSRFWRLDRPAVIEVHSGISIRAGGDIRVYRCLAEGSIKRPTASVVAGDSIRMSQSTFFGTIGVSNNASCLFVNKGAGSVANTATCL